MKFKLFIVPDKTIRAVALLDRDFILSPNIKMDKDCTVLIDNDEIANNTANEINNFTQQIMHIKYLDKQETINNLNINPEIDFSVKKKWKKFCTQKYITENNTDTISNNIKINIVLKRNQPISFRPRCLAFSDKEKLQKILDDLLKNKIIWESNSPYASPIVLVRKKNGELRLCIHYGEINEITIKNNFPTSLIDDHLDKLRDKKYFNNLDLRNRFYHMKIAEASIKYTFFVTRLDQFEIS